MTIVVCVKQVPDTTVPLRLLNGAVRQEAPWPIVRVGAADRAALDEALNLRSRLGGTVTAISAGETEAVDALRFCLARGADRAVHVRHTDALDPVGTATAVATALLGERTDLVLCGGRSGDGASGRFPAELAARLDWPLVTAVAGLTVERELWLRVERRVDRGDREIVRSPLPAVLAVEATLAEPRYVSVRARCHADSLPIEEVPSDGTAVARCELLALELPKPRPRRVGGPDAQLPAMDRLAHLLGGGIQQKQAAAFVEGNPGAVVAEIMRFLEERGFVRAQEGHPDV
jgi:electron transfer flavoprotein alpha/beta subunit